MNKRLLSLILSIILVICAVAPLSVFAFMRNEVGEAVLLQEGNYDLPEEIRSVPSIVNDGKTSEEYIHEQLLLCNDSIYIYDYNVPETDFVAFYSKIINDHPDLFFVSSTVHYDYHPTNHYVVHITPYYSMEHSEIEDAKELFDSGCAKSLSIIDDSMNDLQIALTLHDYVCNLAHYPNVDLVLYDKNIYHSAYGLFYDGEIVCAGYTLIYSYLMNSAGVPCEYVASVPMEHAWNKVKIGDYWYNVDCTWDDLDYNSEISINGSVSHYYFLRSDNKFDTQECSFHSDGITYEECTADSTLYDSAFWDDVSSNIITVDGCFYYLDPDFENHYTTLTRRTVNGTEKVVKKLFTNVYTSYYTSGYDHDGNEYSVLRYDMFARLVWLDNRFYFQNSNMLYSVSLNGELYTITNQGTYVLGLSVDDYNNLAYQGYYEPETINVLDKHQYYNDYLTVEKGSNYNNYPDINNDGVINAKDYVYITKRTG